QRTEQAVRPRWKRRAGPALESGCTSTFLFLGRSWEASCLSVWGEAGRLLVRFLCPVCVFSRTYIFPFTGESYQQDVFSRRGQVMYATGGQAFSRLLPYLKMARTSNA
ncbi:unnamed protein product, partial [Ascophyllum nodosum]